MLSLCVYSLIISLNRNPNRTILGPPLSVFLVPRKTVPTLCLCYMSIYIHITYVLYRVIGSSRNSFSGEGMFCGFEDATEGEGRL